MTGLVDPSLWESVESLKVSEELSCPVCNWETHHFYRLGAEPNPDDPDERGFCGSCLADLLAGNGPFDGSDYRVIDADRHGHDLEYPVVTVEVHARAFPDDETAQQEVATDFAYILENALESFTVDSVEGEIEIGHVEAQVLEPERRAAPEAGDD
ncbi:hypothetical protein HLRTI_000479 [Halorhabdus tiamatea SARL4B]|uniref:Uncharacterized protein n=1 Tax=Halorhabdus tiamatea SARL4B TaxID=1033806 RepID=F7PLX7_9EURY|nr:hypothetical protein [Halorhabdus tiamatea]ERJ07437.1 hypothetical protein HLRTI_000479 [Halorhabdus tiamatea SARL4B]